MKTIEEVLENIRKKSQNEKEKGTSFERLSRYWLMNDPLWKNRLSDVWMWKDAPTNDGADLGIDLVAKDREDGSFWAIQCKCLDDAATLNYKEVGTFYGKTGNKDDYAHTMIITTAGRLSDNLQKIADDWNTQRINTEDILESEVDFEPFLEGKTVASRVLYETRPHQKRAIDDCIKGFSESARGQLIMACGTGKTLTALRLAESLLEKENKKGGRILFLAPSIALVGQSMRAWANQSRLPMACAVVCSDAKASSVDSDVWESSLRDLPYPASTDPDALFDQMSKADDQNSLVVVFSTYQSIQVVADAQKKGLPAFDIVFCDEAHRTTGAVGSKEEVSEYVKVHDESVIQADKRLYMTATPRIYGDRVKKMAKADSYVVSSMDDIETYGPEFHHLSFGRAVDEGLLTDYKVIALTMPESVVSEVYQRAMMEEGDGFDITESARIIGCWKGLLDQGDSENGHKLKNAVAFCTTIAESERISDYFQRTVDEYIKYEHERGVDLPDFRCKILHVDGGMDAKTRTDRIKWLADTEEGEDASCHILSNARCLAEGVDVPNLDAVLFLQPKRSQIDITQAVGRVMRKFEGKQFGYIILPIVIPAGLTAAEALDDNETYAAVWDILKALRSHDERLDARINAINFDKGKGEPVVKVVDGTEISGEESETSNEEPDKHYQYRMSMTQELQEAVNALIVKKCGTKVYWDVWAKDIARIAKRHIERITEIVQNDEAAKKEFGRFLRGLRDSLNDSITDEQAVEMLAQHIITLPVFEALFGGNGFAESNPVSIAMETMLSTLRKHTLETEDEKSELEELYTSVRIRAEGIQTDAGRQSVIKELYESFFKEAFKATSEKMGIVYTPNQVVDYILHATDRLLQKEFGQHLYDPSVHILDAFTGTGTFIVNLINDEELMPADKLPYKYANEIHCNEIMLLAYYIATINIENAYHNRVGGEEYRVFPGAVLTDTFQMYEEGDSIDRGMFIQNTVRGLQQMALPIHVLIGNPPYSAKQKSANDNNANESYPTLDKRISDTYAMKTAATNKNAIYDSYIRAFRWASDRICEKGIISFVTNGKWLKSDSADGFRKSLVEEFSSIYVFDLRGNQRTKGEESKKEGGKIFGSGSRASVTITVLVKNPQHEGDCDIFYHDIGDYLSREEKLSIVAKCIKGEFFDWDRICPDKHGDWIEQRKGEWYNYAPLGIQKFKKPYGIFETWSLGVATARDAWVWNYSREILQNSIKKTISFYNRERIRFLDTDKSVQIGDFVQYNEDSIKWNRDLLQYCQNNKEVEYNESNIVLGLYRPYCKQLLYYGNDLNAMLYQTHRLFPVGKDNLCIILSRTGDFTCVISNVLPDLNVISGGSQCFPMFWYEKNSKGVSVRHDAISDEMLNVLNLTFNDAFHGRSIKDGGISINKKDVFYYVYGLLHSKEYVSRFKANLKKEIPRIPISKNFRTFSAAGRELANLHINYESVDLYPLEVVGDEFNPGRVEKMRWAKKKNKETGKSEDDKTTLVYNSNLTFKGIPEVANRYIVNGRSPLEWMIDRYQVKTDKASGITNDPNEYSDDPCYISNLVRRLVTVSVRTMEIIDGLPPIEEIEQPLDWPEAWSVSLDNG